MISWIQKYFQHHFRLIFAVLLVLIIISFVFVTNTSGGFGHGDRRYAERRFFGYNLNNQQDQQKLFGDAQLSLQIGAMAEVDARGVEEYALKRATALHLADEWHVPASSGKEIEEAVRGVRMFQSPDGQFDPKAYATFRDSLKANPRGPTEADIARVLGDNVRVNKVNQLLAGPGYVLPSDVKTQLARADTSWTLGTATADYAAFKPELKPTEAELTKFYDENSFRYEIPPRVQVTYADFSAAAYLSQVQVTEADVRAYYDQNPARFPKPADAKPATPAVPSDPAADFLLVRSQVEAALKLERARALAAKAASDFAYALYEAKVTNGPVLENFLAARKITAKPLAPFTRDAGPVELGGSPEIATAAFGLNEQRFASDAIPTPNGAVVLFWKDTQAARKPLFSEVREKVNADYIENEKRKRFVELGKTIKAQLEARLKAGDAFEKAAAAAANGTGLTLEAKTIPAFTLRTRPQDIDYSVLGALEQLNRGQVSDMALNPDKGIFVYAADKKVPEVSESDTRFVETRNQLAQFASRQGASAYLSEVMEKELKKSEPKVE